MSSSGEVTPEVQALVLDRIENLDQLQILVAIAGSGARGLGEAELAAAAGIAPDTATEAIAGLWKAGLVIREEGPEGADIWCLGDDDPKQTDAVRALEAQYQRNPVPIIRMLTAKAIDRVRTAAIRTFADAFILGGKKDG